MSKHNIKNKKIIGLIYWFLTAVLGLGGLMLLLFIFLFAESIYNPDIEPFFPVVDIPIDIYESALLEFKSGEQYEILLDEAFLSFNVNREYGFAGILNFIYFISMLLIAYYIIILMWKIFRSIRFGLKTDNIFLTKNVWRIRLVAFIILFSAVLEIIYPFILKYFWFDKIILFEKSFDLRLRFDAGIDLFWALIILVIAEIYRIGLETKKEQELTI
jgi:hypothetical protein